jgi:DNA-binding CsgD family transcriptional regulator
MTPRRRLPAGYLRSADIVPRRVVAWTPRGSTPADGLNLRETVILRRKQNGESDAAIGRVMGCSGSSIGGVLKTVRVRFGVATTPELLALPRIQEILNDDGGTPPAAPR